MLGGSDILLSNLVFTKGLKNLLSSLFESKKSLEIGARY